MRLKETLFALLLVLLVSCVTAQDLAQLQANMDDFQGGYITKPEFDERNADVYETIEVRTAEVREQASKLPTDPLSVLLYLGGMAATAATAGKGVMVVRDGKRKKRGEAV